jgi:hypothetical protein
MPSLFRTYKKMSTILSFFNLWNRRYPSYHMMDEESDEEVKTAPSVIRTARRCSCLTGFLWVVSTIVFASISVWQFHHCRVHHGRVSGELGTYEKGFATDFGKSEYSRVTLLVLPFTINQRH